MFNQVFRGSRTYEFEPMKIHIELSMFYGYDAIIS